MHTFLIWKIIDQRHLTSTLSPVATTSGEGFIAALLQSRAQQGDFQFEIARTREVCLPECLSSLSHQKNVHRLLLLLLTLHIFTSFLHVSGHLEHLQKDAKGSGTWLFPLFGPFSSFFMHKREIVKKSRQKVSCTFC